MMFRQILNNIPIDYDYMKLLNKIILYIILLLLLLKIILS